MLGRPPFWWLSSGFLRIAIAFLSATVPLASVLEPAHVVGPLLHSGLHELHAEIQLPPVETRPVVVEALHERVDSLLVVAAPAHRELPEANHSPFLLGLTFAMGFPSP